MDRVQSMFVNPFSTPAGELVEKATAISLSTEDWGMNMQLCDVINNYADGGKDAVKAIKKRLATYKNFNQIYLTLSLLEACIKNCGSSFHILVTTKDFCLDSLLKVIQSKNSPPLVLKQRVLGLIKQLAETFGSNPAMVGARQAYDELKEHGYEFPSTEPWEGIIRTNIPQTSTSPPISSENISGQCQPRAINNPLAVFPETNNQNQIVELNATQVAKLTIELEIVEGNIKGMSKMLTELNPLHCDINDYELLQKLSCTCRLMQQRIVKLIEQVANERITVDLLHINDDINNTLVRYDQFLKRFRTSNEVTKSSSSGDNSLLSMPFQSTSVTSTTNPDIGQSDGPPSSSFSDAKHTSHEKHDLVNLHLGMPTDTSHSLSQNLESMNLSSQQPASHSTLSQQLAAFDKPDDKMENLDTTTKEIEEWLTSDSPAFGFQAEASSKDSTDVTDEFSSFLNARTAASKNLQDLPSKNK